MSTGRVTLPTAYCALVDLTGPQPRVPEHDIDWPGTIALARRHKVLPLLAHGIHRTGIESTIPEAQRTNLATLRRRLALRSLRHTRDTVTVVDSLLANGVGVTVMKGAAIGKAVYGNAALRSPGDIDILISPHDLCATTDTLAGLGYRPLQPGILESAHKRARLLRHAKDFTFIGPGERTTLECHWRLHANPKMYPVEPMDRRAPHTVVLGTRTIPTLPPIDHFVYLCFHGVKHLYQRLKWLNDIRWILHDGAFIDHDWNAVAGRATTLRKARLTAATMQLAAHCDPLRYPAPLHTLMEKHPSADRIVRDCLRLQSCAGVTAGDPQRTLMDRAQFNYRSRRAAKPDGTVFGGAIADALRPTAADIEAFDAPFGWEWPLALRRIAGHRTGR